MLSQPDPDPSVPLIRSVQRGDIVQPTITRWSHPPQLQPTRRLQQGWWPDAQKRTERSFQAMQDLRGETFVVTEDNLEWTFNVDDETKAPLEPQYHILLPATKRNNDKTLSCCAGGDSTSRSRTSNECAICMTKYEPGNVVIHSANCSHAFHQNCLLDWCSRENYDCPVCRTTFWDPKKSKGANEKKMSAVANNSRSGNGEEPDGVVFGMVRRRSRSDTDDIDTLSEYAREYCFSSRG